MKKIFLLWIIPVWLVACSPSALTPLPPSVTLSISTAIETSLPTEVLATPIPTISDTPTPVIVEDNAFWQNLGPMPKGILVSETALSDRDPTKDDDLDFDRFPPVTPVVWIPTPQKNHNLDGLSHYAYKILYDKDGNYQDTQLYRDGRVLFNHVGEVSNVYTFHTKSGLIKGFRLERAASGSSFVVENDVIYSLGGYSIHTYGPVLYKDEVLWAREDGSSIEVKKSNGHLVFKYNIKWIPNHRLLFREWNGHWILEDNGLFVQDGVVQTNIFDYQNGVVYDNSLDYDEIFGWGLIGDKPFYFFRKGSKVGISYDSKILPISFEKVAHYLCCSFTVNNPYIWGDSITYYGKRDGHWYFVKMDFKE